MTNPGKIKTLALLSQRGFTVVSGREDLEFYVSEIGWNMRSLMRQADMLETAVSEMKRLLHEKDRTSAGTGVPHQDPICSVSPGPSQTGVNNAGASPEDVAKLEK